MVSAAMAGEELKVGWALAVCCVCGGGGGLLSCFFGEGRGVGWAAGIEGGGCPGRALHARALLRCLITPKP